MNPEHERRAREILQEELPDLYVSLVRPRSCRSRREFERTATTVANAYCAPVLRRYLDTLERAASPTSACDRLFSSCTTAAER